LKYRVVNPPTHRMPPAILTVVEKIRRCDLAALRDFAPNEANAIDYDRAAGMHLLPHVDDRQMSSDVLVNLSLAGDCTMTYSQEGRRGFGLSNSERQTVDIYLPRRSLQVRSNPEPRAPNPKPQTANPEPQTPNPKPQTPNPKPQTSNPEPQNPKPKTPNPEPQTPNLGPQTPNPKPQTSIPQTPNYKPQASNTKPQTPNPKPKTQNPKPKPPNPSNLSNHSNPKPHTLNSQARQVQSGQARYNFAHAIANNNLHHPRRVSITFRQSAAPMSKTTTRGGRGRTGGGRRKGGLGGRGAGSRV
jgi:hypothetical protein